MTDFMCDDVRLREISRRTELPAQFFVESKIDIDLLVTRTIERSNRSAGNATSRAYLARKQDQRGFSILSTILSKHVLPNVFRLRQDHRYELLQFFLFSISRTRTLHLRWLFVWRLLQQCLRIEPKHQSQDHYQQCSQPTADRDSSSPGHTTPVLDIRALTFTSPTHSLFPPILRVEIASAMCHANNRFMEF